MGQDRGDVSIGYNNGSPGFDPSPPAQKNLDKNDWFDVKAVGFPVEAKIAAIDFFHDQAKTQEVGQWTPSGGSNSGLNGRFSVSRRSDIDVRITDVEDARSDDEYWYSVRLQSGSTQWTLDPVIINKRSLG